MDFKFQLDKEVNIEQLHKTIYSIYGEDFFGISNHGDVLVFHFSSNVKVTEEAVATLLMDHVPVRDTREDDRREALEALKRFVPEEVTDKNVVRCTQQLMTLMADLQKIIFS